MKKMLAALLALLLAVPAFAGVPDAPTPKPEVAAVATTIKTPFIKSEPVKFGAATVFFAGSAVFQVLAQHHGAQLCKIEDERAGEGNLFGTADYTGHRPDNADRREAYITGGVYAGALVLELTGHRKAAKRILIFGGTANYGIAGATYWAGCN